jgi:uncharacterized protein (TIGR02271 family)
MADEERIENRSNEGSNASFSETIPVIEEQVRIDKKQVETGKVHIYKTVQEHETSVSIPLTQETYEVERVPVNQVVDTPPAAVRYEGETMIIPVLREVMVVQKRYEIVEEVRVTKKTTQNTESQQVTLLREEVHVERSNAENENGQQL